MEDFNNTTNYFDLIDMYLPTAAHVFFSSAFRTFNEINHMLG